MISVCVGCFLTLPAKTYKLQTDYIEAEMEGTTPLLKELLSVQGLQSKLVIWAFVGMKWITASVPKTEAVISSS